MNRNSFQSSGVNLSQVNMNTQNINNLTRAITKLRNEISTSFIKLSDTPSFFGSAGQVVAVNSTRTGLVFVNQATGGGGGGGSTTLSGLTDTDTSTSSDNHLLQYNSTSQLWENVSDLHLPGTLNVTAHTTLGSLGAANINLGSYALINSGLHEIHNDVTFRGDTYIRKQGTNGDVGFYCNTQTNPPRVGIGTTQPDDTLTVKGIFGIRESFQEVPALFSQSTTGGGYVLVNTNTQTAGHQLTVGGQTALEGNLKLAGQLGVGTNADAGIPNFILSSQGGGINPTWIKPYNIDSFYLTEDIENQQSNVDEFIPYTSANTSFRTWERKDSSANYQSLLLGFAPSAGFYTTANTTGTPQPGYIVEPVSDGSGNNLFRFTQAGIYKITFHATIYARQTSIPDFGHVELQHLVGGVAAILERFEVSYSGSSGIIPTTHHGETFIKIQDQDYIRVAINAPVNLSTTLRTGLPFPAGTPGNTLAAATATYINFEYLPIAQ